MIAIKKIYSITEAFSIQPRYYAVCKESDIKTYPNPIMAIKEIKKEDVLINHEKHTCYICYNWDDKAICQFLEESVNIEFYYEEM